MVYPCRNAIAIYQLLKESEWHWKNPWQGMKMDGMGRMRTEAGYIVCGQKTSYRGIYTSCKVMFACSRASCKKIAFSP